jgi:putative ABC transport system ATP-binding protein
VSTMTSASDDLAAVGAGPGVELHGVAKRYDVGPGVVTALHEVDLVVDRGELVVILGPSGSGKTTLLNVIGALDAPSEGVVRVGGVDLTRASARARTAIRRRTVSFVFQSFNLFPGLTAIENVRFGLDVAGRRERGEAADLLRRVGLAERAHHFPHQLSGGEQQRVAIARALATGNPVLLADEPTGELDVHTGVQILRLLREQADAGTTVLVVTHNREIGRMADRVVELSGGRVVRDGPPEGGSVAVDELRW